MSNSEIDSIEKCFFENHTVFINKLAAKVYTALTSAVLLVLILTLLDIYNYPKILAVITFAWSILLSVILFIMLKKKVNATVYKYVCAFMIQSIIFLLSIDINLQPTVMFLIMPLITFMYFDPQFTIYACVLAALSAFAGCVCISDQAIVMFWPNISKSYYILTTGSGRLIEMVVVTILLCISAIQAKRFMKSVLQRNIKMNIMQKQMVYSFADIIESRDCTTGKHVKRTSQTVSLIVHYLADNKLYQNKLTLEDMHFIELAAPLHDIGKMTVPDTILTKKGALTTEEFDIIKRHPEEGGKLIDATLKNMEDARYITIAKEMAVYHHEHWDGQGYPAHLKGEEIPISARIMAIADVFDALCSVRSYKDAYPVAEAFQILRESSGTHFEPMLVEIMFILRPQLEQMYISENAAR